MKTINYKGKGEHSVNELELIIEQQAEELHLIKSGQTPLIIDGVVVPKGTCCLNAERISHVTTGGESWSTCSICGKEIV